MQFIQTNKTKSPSQFWCPSHFIEIPSTLVLPKIERASAGHGSGMGGHDVVSLTNPMSYPLACRRFHRHVLKLSLHHFFSFSPWTMHLLPEKGTSRCTRCPNNRWKINHLIIASHRLFSLLFEREIWCLLFVVFGRRLVCQERKICHPKIRLSVFYIDHLDLECDRADLQ